MNMTFRQMEILVAAAEAATFSAAAKKLDISEYDLSANGNLGGRGGGRHL